MQCSTLSWIIVFCACATSPDMTGATSVVNSYGDFQNLPDTFLQQVMARLGEEMGGEIGAGEGPGDVPIDDQEPIMDQGNDLREESDQSMPPSRRGEGDFQSSFRNPASQNFMGPSLRDQEYLQHSSLWGHKYVQGGAGEGKQRLKPDGSMKNGQTIKTDAVLPAYCNPPNPCPIGYTASDGCLEDFVNTASFSRDYQLAQECMCDSEHMFDCPNERGEGGQIKEVKGEASGHREREIEALARSMQHEGLVDSTLDRIVQKIEGEHKTLVAKKFFIKKSNLPVRLPRQVNPVEKKQNYTSQLKTNPYLMGEKLPVVAKKGIPGIPR